MRLQYQLSNGNWINCNEDGRDRTEEFLQRCMTNNRIDADGKINNRATYATDRTLNRDEAVAALESNKELRNDKNDWYSNCRDGEAYDKKIAERRAKAEAAKDYPEGRKLKCGHVVHYKSQVMSASMGSSCADCYDRMSD